MTLNELRKLTCTPCPNGTSPLSRGQARERLMPLAGWQLTGQAKSISKTFLMKDFSAAIALMKAILPVAQAEDHHPDLHLTNYRKLQIVLSTHDVGGLSNNDFILAAKIEALPKGVESRLNISIRSLIIQVLSQGWEDEVPRMSAALAFYTVFSLAPILVVVIAIAGLVFGQKMALDQVIDQIQQLIGRQSAEAVQAMIEASVKPSSSILATVIGVIILLAGATGALVELQDGLNRVWKVKTVGGMTYLIKQRLTSLALVAGIAFLLLVSLVISAGLSAVGTLISHHLTAKEALWHGTDFTLSCFVITALFAMIFRTLPETFIRWSDVWMGAAVTAILFTAGKFLMGLYLGKGALTSTYGAAGSFVAVLMWVYYSALVFYFGAEFTKAYADRYGSHRSVPLSATSPVPSGFGV